MDARGKLLNTKGAYESYVVYQLNFAAMLNSTRHAIYARPRDIEKYSIVTNRNKIRAERILCYDMPRRSLRSAKQWL